MDVRAQGSRRERPGGSGRGRPVRARRVARSREAPDAWVGQRLGEWQAREVRLARAFAECRGLSSEQLEDIYQETSVALLTRGYLSEEHLRHALHVGIKHRALNHHRDERRRGRILTHHAPGIYALAEAGAGEDAPEPVAMSREDRLVVSEFLTELDPLERRVFSLMAEGLRYRAIAPALAVDTNAARKASRAVERKRQRFQLLYDTGRLCGFRARTILALQNGEATSEQLAERAFAHLESCAACRADHGTNAKSLRRRFQGEAAALLPGPLIAAHLWPPGARLRALLQRFIPDALPAGPGGVRDGAIGLFAGGGVVAKATVAGLATVAAVAGGIRASEAPVHHPRPKHSREHAGKSARQQAASASTAPTAAPIIPRPGNGRSDSQNASQRRAANRQGTTTRREPGGFAYLGVPSRSTGGEVASARATSASVASSAPSAPSHASTSTSGGEFSP